MGLNGASDPEAVMARRREFAEQVGFDLGSALMTVQEHGANVLTFQRTKPEGGQCVFSTDALATDVSGQAIITYHADCFPLFILDRHRGVVAGAHAGWRGALAGVPAETVRAMQRTYGTRPEQLEVLIGPGICVKCYPVGKEIGAQFASRYGREDQYLRIDDNEVRLDIEAVVRLDLEDAGVSAKQVRSSGWCTREEDRWFSHRAGRDGRFLAVIVAP